MVLTSSVGCASHPTQEKAERTEGKRAEIMQGEGSPSYIHLEISLLLDLMFLACEALGLIL